MRHTAFWTLSPHRCAGSASATCPSLTTCPSLQDPTVTAFPRRRPDTAPGDFPAMASPASVPPRPSRRRASSALLVVLLTTAAVATGPSASSATSTPSSAAPATTLTGAATASATATSSGPVPPTPEGLTSEIEPYQPYVGQQICDPRAKAGVSAFRDLLLRTYPSSGSLGIVRDCGSGGRSEHKEGRAFDWANNVNNPEQAGNVEALMSWLMATDEYGNQNAMIRRTGLMYVIWNKRIWKSYEVAEGWQPYYGSNPHTDHVHFSFSWAGARMSTSYWHPGTVAAIDYGPAGPPEPSHNVTVTADRTNIAIQQKYGELTLSQDQERQSVPAVKVVQAKVGASPVDGIYGPDTAAAVRSAQLQLDVLVTGQFAPPDWDTFFPLPNAPFGRVDSVSTVPGGIRLTGWVLDHDTSDPVLATIGSRELGRVGLVTADLPRDDVARAYPEAGALHGFDTTVTLPDGTHQLCVNGINASGTTGQNMMLGCTQVSVDHQPQGVLDVLTQRYGATLVSGWAVDTDTADPVPVDVWVDGKVVTSTIAGTRARPEAAAKFTHFEGQRGYFLGVDVPEGRHRVCTSGRGLGAGHSANLGCRTITVNRSPKGGFNLAITLPASYPQRGPVLLKGWAFDMDTDAPVAVRITVDGVVKRIVRADVPRADVAKAYPMYGPDHGFETTLALRDGVRKICVDARNLGSRGTARELGCKLVTVADPVGAFEHAVGGNGLIAVSGWAYDPDAINPTDVVVLVDGERVGQIRTSRPRPDLTVLALVYGPVRGFGGTVPATPGRHEVCLVAYNLYRTPGQNTPLGCTSRTVR